MRRTRCQKTGMRFAALAACLLVCGQIAGAGNVVGASADGPGDVTLLSAGGSTITVGLGEGYDFSTIQEAIDAAVDSDVVLVASGEYVITAPVTFRGQRHQ